MAAAWKIHLPSAAMRQCREADDVLQNWQKLAASGMALTWPARTYQIQRLYVIYIPRLYIIL